MRPWLPWCAEVVREWDWRHTLWGVAVGSLAVFNMGEIAFMGNGIIFHQAWMFNVLQFGMPYVFALRVADRAVAAGVGPLAAYAAVVLIVIPVGIWVFGRLLSPTIGFNAAWTSRMDISLATTRLLPFALGTLVYAYWRRERETLGRVQAAEVARATQQRLVQASRLLALQARVEPQFLFDALERVRALTERSTEAAEQLLTDLIALLRAMQPAAGATASTVAREFALVESYARASETAALQAPRLQLHADAESAEARFAPLVLLPALRQLVGDAPAARWQVGALRVNDRLRLVIAPTAELDIARVALKSIELQPLQQRLGAVHGDDAVLAVASGDEPALHLEVPFQADDESPDR